MTTQSKLNKAVEDPTTVEGRSQLNWPLALGILVLGIVMGMFAANLPVASHISGGPERTVRDFPARPNMIELEEKALIATEAQLQRGLEAEAARYTSLGMFYAAGNEVNVQRAIEAEAARYSGLATLYAGINDIDGQRGLEAEAARYTGMAKLHLNKSLAWPPRPTQFYAVENTIAPFIEKDLAIYHQSEWGRTFSTILPVIEAKFEVEVNDAGVNRLNCGPVSSCVSPIFTIVNNVGVPRHDREYGLVAFSTGPEANQDIGIMEFLTTEK